MLEISPRFVPSISHDPYILTAKKCLSRWNAVAIQADVLARSVSAVSYKWNEKFWIEAGDSTRTVKGDRWYNSLRRTVAVHTRLNYITTVRRIDSRNCIRSAWINRRHRIVQIKKHDVIRESTRCPRSTFAAQGQTFALLKKSLSRIIRETSTDARDRI